MPKYSQTILHEQQSQIERPLHSTFAPSVLKDEKLMLIKLMPEHRFQLHAEIFHKPQVMQYFGTGRSYTFEEYSAIHMMYAQQNLMPDYDQYTGKLSRFTWTVITHDGIAGRLNIYPAEGRTELAYCISPMQQGRALARRSSELVVSYLGEETSYIATAHPKNKASSKTLEQIHYSDEQFVFIRDLKRQNATDKYGATQPRDYFLSQSRNKFSFFSFIRGQVDVNVDEELAEEKQNDTISLS